MFSVFYIVIICIIALLITRPLTALIYQLGHAIPALILTKSSVDVFIGAYEETEEEPMLKLSRLTIYIKPNPLFWSYSISLYNDEKINFFKKILIILFAPITSLSFGITCFYWLFNSFEDDRLMFLGLIILTSTLIDIYLNIKPNHKRIKLHNGRTTYNDGKLLLKLLNLDKVEYSHYSQINELIIEDRFLEAAIASRALIEEGILDKELFKSTVELFLLEGEDEMAKDFFDEFSPAFDEVTKKEAQVFFKTFILYSKIDELLAEQKYSEVITCCETFIEEESIIDIVIFEMMLSCFFSSKQYKMGKDFFDKFHLQVEKNIAIYINIGAIYSGLDDKKRSIEMYNKALAIDPNNLTALNNRGFQRNENGNYKDAINDFDKAISLDPSYAYAYSNRGFSKIHLGLDEEGLKDVKTSISIDSGNSYAYRTLGIYFIKKGDHENALKNLNLALELDDGTFQIQHLIDKAEKM
jgi:tetratricopeptide (TPR) repeat protein